MKGQIIGNIDLAQVILYMFWVFLGCLLVYLHRENKREGYPLVSDRSPFVTVQGFPAVPPAKTYLLADGGTQTSPRKEAEAKVNGTQFAQFPGSPIEPNGNPLLAGVGPGSWAERANKPDLTVNGHPRIMPMRDSKSYHVDRNDPDPRGMTVVGADRVPAGKVVDIWVDRSESIARYLEVELAGLPSAGAATPATVLLPIPFCKFQPGPRRVVVLAIMGRQFADVPRIAGTNEITRREEDRISAYYGAGKLYASPQRTEAQL